MNRGPANIEELMKSLEEVDGKPEEDDNWDVEQASQGNLYIEPKVSL